MSRLANKPLEIPKGVTVIVHPGFLEIKGTKKNVHVNVPLKIHSSIEGHQLSLRVDSADAVEMKVMLGTVWANLKNALQGVSSGFKAQLVLVGVGYRVQIQGSKVNLTLGLSHPVVYILPVGVTAEAPSQTEIVLSSHDNCLLGQAAAEIQAYRPPECYKGKGIKFLGQVIKLKEVKKK